jgi:hypothetical protein
MKTETPEETFNRLRDQIQKAVLTGYPNPQRINCPGSAVIAAYSQRVMDFEDIVESEEPYKHITHCSPCYAEFLKANDEVRAQRRAAGHAATPMSRKVQKRMARAVNGLEREIKATGGGR